MSVMSIAAIGPARISAACRREGSMIELLQFKPALGLMNASPFCMKAEVFLRLGGLPYRAVDTMPFGSPKGKLPVLRDDAAVIADSSAIVAHLQQHHAGRLPPALRVPDDGERIALRRLIEEHLYFVMLWARWIADAGWAITKPAFFGALPPLVRDAVAGAVRRKIRRDLAGQGIGRHQPDEIYALGCEDVEAAARILGARPYFGGDAPGAIDATAYAFLANVVWVPLETPVKAAVVARPRLVAYCERMRAAVGA
jgi:glutathione S-transferase